MTEEIPEIIAQELTVGDMVAFGRPNSPVVPAIGIITKVNRMTYQVELTSAWVQVKKTYHAGVRFRCSRGMVWRRLPRDGDVDV